MIPIVERSAQIQDLFGTMPLNSYRQSFVVKILSEASGCTTLEYYRGTPPCCLQKQALRL